MPVLQYTRGICPETGRRVVARGVVGVGRLATGVIAIGHASFGVIAIGQLAVAVIFGLGQAATGAVALGQLAIALLFGAGQIATGATAIGQIALGDGPRPVTQRSAAPPTTAIAAQPPLTLSSTRLHPEKVSPPRTPPISPSPARPYGETGDRCRGLPRFCQAGRRTEPGLYRRAVCAAMRCRLEPRHSTSSIAA